MSDSAAERCADTLKALGHPIRLRIMDILDKDERNVGELAELLGVKSAIVSQQLKILRLSGLVKLEKKEGHSYYRPAFPKISQLLACIKQCELDGR